MMRKLIASLFISLDGVTESPETWQFDHADQDMFMHMGSTLATQDAFLMGRVLYELWAKIWPTSKIEPFASSINTTQKYVVSKTLEEVAWGKWNNISLINGDLKKEITKLKQQPGKNIGMTGSSTLVRSLLEAYLLDELTLMVHPVIVGHGKRLFIEDMGLKRMQLLNTKMTKTGVLINTYQPYEKRVVPTSK